MNIFEFDKSNMRDVILNFSKQFSEGIKAARNVGSQYTTYNIQYTVIAGMGGSALPGELLKLLSAHFNWHIRVDIHKSYGLPWFINSPPTGDLTQGEKLLVVCISYSGNTEETISAYREAKKLNLPLAVITTGGELARLAQYDKTPLALIIPKSDIQPRAAIGYQLAALIKILSNAKIIESQDKDLLSIEKSPNSINLESQGKELAEKLKNKTPLIYASQNYKALAYIWKIKFNENSKIHAFWNYFPELNHNEMVGYSRNTQHATRNKNFYTVILKSEDDHPRIKERMMLTAELIESQKGYIETIDIKGNGVYNRVFNTILLADWTSYYLALEYGIDPSPVDIVEEFKKKLK